MARLGEFFNKFYDNQATQVGLGLLAKNTGNYGNQNIGAGLAYGMNNYQTMQDAKVKREQDALAQQRQEQQRSWMQNNMPQYVNAPADVRKAGIEQMYRAPVKPSAFDQKLDLYNSDPEKYRGMFPPNSTSINMNENGSRVVSDEQKASLGLDASVPYFWNKQGIPTPVKRTNYTEGQLTANGFAERMQGSEDNIQGLMGLGYDPSQLYQQIAGNSSIGNFALNEDDQVYKQARMDWVRAKLRKESGAVIGEQEMIDEVKTYFPQAGDSAPVIEQKRISRRRALEGMSRMSGGSYTLRDAKREAAKSRKTGSVVDDASAYLKGAK